MMVARSLKLIVLIMAAVTSPALARDTIAVQNEVARLGNSQASPPNASAATATTRRDAGWQRLNGQRGTSESAHFFRTVEWARLDPRSEDGPSSRRFDASFDEGMAALRDNNPVRALELMKPFLADFEKQYAGEKRQMFCALTPRQSAIYLADAARAKRAAVAVEPSWCRAQYVRGFALIDLGKLDDALVAFQNLTALAPKNSRYLNELGFVLLQQKKWNAAIDVFSRSALAADLSPDDLIEEQCAAYGGMGSSMMEIGRLDDAEAAFRRCLALRPGDQTMLDALDAIAAERKQTV